jgi:hypothetical protein
MLFRNLRWAFATFVCMTALCSVWTARAEEEEGKKSEAAAPLPKDQKEFSEKTARLNSLTTRIEEDEKQFQEMVQKKSEEKSTDERQRIIKQMVEVTNDRNKSALEFNKLKSELSLRYPNQGEHLDRNYRTQSKKTVEELEGAAGLDELLTRTKKIVEKKFAPFNPPQPEVKKAKVEEVSEDRPKPLRLEK